MLDFLSALWGDDFAWGELRCIRNGAVRQQFFKPPEMSELVSAATEWNLGGWDSYFGILPRLRQSGKAEDCEPMTRVLWQDIDSKHFDGKKMSALIALGRAGIDPSILVDSGNGIHAYWLLRDPIAFDQAALVMKGMAQAIGGDHVYDAPRVLRLPGTTNHKTPPHPVRLLHFDPERRYRFSDFDNYLPEPAEFVRAPMVRPPNAQNYDELPDWLRELIEEPTPKGYRSGAIFKAMLWLIRYGWGYDDIHDLLIDFPDGFGEKVAEMREKEAERWIARTYRRAEVAATTEDSAA